MVLGSHVIMAAYGFWLPNDPRGSWSDFVGAWELLLRSGKATRTFSRASVANVPHDEQVRLAAKEALKYPAVHFTGIQARAIGRAFATVAREFALDVLACSILPEHTHLVIARHPKQVERIVNCLKGEATRHLIREGIHPLAEFPTRAGRMPKAWSRGHWKVFLDCPADIDRAIAYVRDNPMKEGKPAQTWSFVKELGKRA
jgi:REP element-mobilizing transposase RayT